MPWMIGLCIITAFEHIAHPFLTGPQTWELALDAKYLSLAFALQALIVETKLRPILFRSVIALFCIGAWVDTVSRLAYSAVGIDSTLPVIIVFASWLIYNVKREFDTKSDTIDDIHIFILLLRPRSGLEVVKSFFGLPVSSVCIYHCGYVWSFRKKTGSFDVYKASPRFLEKHVILSTYREMTPAITSALDRVTGTKRTSGIKCVWSIRDVLRKIGGDFAPRWYEYIPGIYAVKLTRCR